MQFHGGLFQRFQVLKHPSEIEDCLCKGFPSEGRAEEFDGFVGDNPAEDFIGKRVIGQEVHSGLQEFLDLFEINGFTDTIVANSGFLVWMFSMRSVYSSWSRVRACW